MPRNRLVYLLLTLSTIAIGLFSRTRFIPDFIYPYLGDFLYCLMYFFLFGLLFPRLASWKLAAMSTLFCYAIEMTQLCQVDWLNAIRSYRLGGLILGFGFLWSDIVAYTLGGLFGYALERYRI